MRPTTEEERAVQEILRSKLGAARDVPARVGYGLFVPSTAITFKVEQVFVQTPGPGAGRQLDLSAEP